MTPRKIWKMWALYVMNIISLIYVYLIYYQKKGVPLDIDLQVTDSSDNENESGRENPSYLTWKKVFLELEVEPVETANTVYWKAVEDIFHTLCSASNAISFYEDRKSSFWAIRREEIQMSTHLRFKVELYISKILYLICDKFRHQLSVLSRDL